MEPQAPCTMDREDTLAPLMGTQSLTPVTQGTGRLEVVQGEHVSRVACGQEAIQHVPVSNLT